VCPSAEVCTRHLAVQSRVNGSPVVAGYYTSDPTTSHSSRSSAIFRILSRTWTNASWPSTSHLGHLPARARDAARPSSRTTSMTASMPRAGSPFFDASRVLNAASMTSCALSYPGSVSVIGGIPPASNAPGTTRRTRMFRDASSTDNVSLYACSTDVGLRSVVVVVDWMKTHNVPLLLTLRMRLQNHSGRSMQGNQRTATVDIGHLPTPLFPRCTKSSSSDAF